MGIQVHLRCLFVLKDDLHVIYNGARVLGAGDDAMIRRRGVITDINLDRASRHIVRKMDFALTNMNHEQCDKLLALLKKEPCALMGLCLDRATTDMKHCFGDMTL